MKQQRLVKRKRHGRNHADQQPLLKPERAPGKQRRCRFAHALQRARKQRPHAIAGRQHAHLRAHKRDMPVGSVAGSQPRARRSSRCWPTASALARRLLPRSIARSMRDAYARTNTQTRTTQAATPSKERARTHMRVLSTSSAKERVCLCVCACACVCVCMCVCTAIPRPVDSRGGDLPGEALKCRHCQALYFWPASKRHARRAAHNLAALLLALAFLAHLLPP
jgi:hypothetical protein